ncbi:hypothetical protein B0F90DRAFT_1717962 [Multifurca ochricompacta]|uniref:Uncharacterized protein n=1 Tax=Multifurca ochricompacta TaxID=376703 RepID=A0AAD4M4V7_9AGAM|nr:hypothetical protein B0F90DRAFT_1717962 [Multifurca ochricompacta]
MGKWCVMVCLRPELCQLTLRRTSEYYDDVLGAKIKSLVSGAVKRSKLEKSEPSISYEAFVEDLDPGDSFTTTLTELLVREMAERRHRQAAADRRLISDRTAKGLRTLAAPQRVYRDRGARGISSRRSLNLTDYLVVPPEEMELDDDNDSLESMMDRFDPSSTVEGARINSDLYDVYANPGSSSISEPHLTPAPPQLRHMLRSATRREDWGLLRETSPDGWGPPSSAPVPSASPLTRQPSIRRPPARSRTVDFTDFTSRRRSSGREADESATQPPGSPSPSASVSASPRLASISNTTSVPPRRFFPFRRPELPWSPIPESVGTSTSTSTGTSTTTATTTGTSTRSSPGPGSVPESTSVSMTTTTTGTTTQADLRDQRTFLSWLPSSTLLSLPPPPPADLRGPRATPRLRRGGVRPPESLFPRPHAHAHLHGMMLRTESPELIVDSMHSNNAVSATTAGAGVDVGAGVGAGADAEGGGPPATSTPPPVVDASRGLSPSPAE